MNINYTYEVVAVDEAARVMEVAYSCEGMDSVHIGVRLPYKGENFEELIDAFSPIGMWKEKQKTVVAPEVGLTGSIEYSDNVQQSISNENMRKYKYYDNSDPIFFQWQRGEATEQDWLDAVQKIKDQYPSGGVTFIPTPASGEIDLQEI